MSVANQPYTQTPPKGLNDFQESYSTYLRTPTGDCPTGIPARRSQVYEELVFNNTSGFIDKCFPVAKSILDAEQWLHLIKLFFKEWSCHTPYFSKIPHEFVEYINDGPSVDASIHPEGIPDWLGSLLHYEWIELEVELSTKNVAIATSADTPEALLTTEVMSNPTLMNLQYDWPVHNISPDSVPSNPILTLLLVYRTAAHTVEFMEVNALTAALLQIIDAQPGPVTSILGELTELVPSINQEQAIQFGLPLINNLLQSQILLRGH